MTKWLVVGVIATAVYVTAEQRPAILTCQVKTEDATGNSRSEVAYYECTALNGGVVPAVTFIVKTDTPGELWLRQLVGRTVDLRLEAVP